MKDNLLLFEVPTGETGKDFIRLMRAVYTMGAAPQNAIQYASELSKEALNSGRPLFLQTAKYDLFELVVSNREVSETHVRALMKAISKKNLLYINPIIVNSKMQLIEGQHRLEAARRLAVPIYYLIDPSLGPEDIASLNSIRKPWGIMDYVNFYAIEKRPEYVLFNKLSNKFQHIKSSWLQALCSYDGKRNVSALREGFIDMDNAHNVELWVGWLKELALYMPSLHSSRGVDAARLLFKKKDYNHTHMVQQMRGILDFPVCKSLSDYKTALFNIHGELRLGHHKRA